MEIESYLERGINEIVPDAQCVKVPVADGGEGTVEAIVSARNGKYRKVEVRDPLGRPVMAAYGLLEEGIAVLEMSAASGITLLKKEELNPMAASTYGTGQMILDALEQGARKLYIGIGGSATNDGGMGMAMALGVRFLDEQGQELKPAASELIRLAQIDTAGLDKRLKEADILILSDVDNPLCGPHGAAAVYGGQKGADEEMKKTLDAYLAHYAGCIKAQLNIDVVDEPGAGAAGGLGAGMLVFTGARMARGIDALLELVQLEEHLQGAALVVTGEGRIDNQTAFGKAPVGIAALAAHRGIPVVAVVGSSDLAVDKVYEKGISLIIDVINQPMTLDEAITNVAELVRHAGKTVGYVLKNFIGK